MRWADVSGTMKRPIVPKSAAMISVNHAVPATCQGDMDVRVGDEGFVGRQVGCTYSASQGSFPLRSLPL